MEVEVYADLLFLINAGMDWLCLSLTARLLHRRTPAYRLIFAAVSGGIYAVLALFLPVGRIGNFLLDGGVCLLMCAVAFFRRGERAVRRWLSATLLYTLLSMVMGGIMTATFYLFNRLGLSALLPAGEEGIGTWLFALTALVSGAVALWGGRLCRRSVSLQTCTVTVEIAGRCITLHGLVDTGNLLRDPLGGRPVICATSDALRPVLPPGVLDVVQAGDMDFSKLPATDARRLRFIPAGTATGSSLLVGICPDTVIISNEDGQTSAAIAIVAISPSPISAPDEAGTVEALVPAELF